jgi:nitrate reductase NapE component
MATTPSHDRSPGTLAAATGLTLFAAVMLFISGILDIFRGIMGIARDDVFVTTPNYVFKFDLMGWGWVHLVLGAVAVAVGIGLFALSPWARVLGVVIASLLIISNFLSIPYYPVWSLTLIALYGFIIWALCVAPRDATTPR